MISIDFKLKVRRFFKKYSKLFLIILFIWLLIFIINRYLHNMKFTKVPTTTYEPNVAVLDSSSEVPEEIATSFDDFVKEYVEACNTGDYKEAYNLISEDCKKNYFYNDYDNFVNYIQNKFTSKKLYAIQNYSNYNDKYIYSVKFFEDFLATGLTNSDYQYQEEFIVASYDEEENVVFSVGNYIESKILNSVASNDYLKVDLKKVIVKYSYEVYEMKLTNRTDYTIVIQNQNTDTDEVCLVVNGEYRSTVNYDVEIILPPNESQTIQVGFPKFYDTKSISEMIVFSKVRVGENYIGVQENVETEFERIVDKFSMNIPID